MRQNKSAGLRARLVAELSPRRFYVAVMLGERAVGRGVQTDVTGAHVQPLMEPDAFVCPPRRTLPEAEADAAQLVAVGKVAAVVQYRRASVYAPPGMRKALQQARATRATIRA